MDRTVSQWQEMLAFASLEPTWLATWSVPLDFDQWVQRMATPEPTRAQHRSLFDDAPDAIREAFALRGGDAYGFDIPIAMLVGRRVES